MIETEELSEIPKNWNWVLLDEIVRVSGGGTPSTKVPEYWNGGITWLTPTDVTASSSMKIRESKRKITKLGLQKSSAKIIPADSVLMTSRATIGEVVINEIPVATNQGFINIQLNPQVMYNKFIAYWIKSEKNYLNSIATGTTFKELSKSKFKTLYFPLAPINEQYSIVNKIDELFSQLDTGAESLQKTKLLLQQYRQSILKAAMEGELTKEWRYTYKDELEPASFLLERILLEHREKWESEQLAKFQAKGEIPKDESWKKEYKEPNISEVEVIKNKPESWCLIKFPLVIEKIKRGPSIKANRDGKGIRYITSGNLFEGKLILTRDNKFVENYEEIDKSKLKTNDLIINCVNSLEQIGKSAVFKEHHGKAIVGFNNYALELTRNILPEYANIFCQSYFFQNQIRFLIKYAVNQVSFAIRELNYIYLPLPSIKEQIEIERSFTRIETFIGLTKRNVDKETIRMNLLRQSILKSAFEGKLVQNSSSKILKSNINDNELKEGETKILKSKQTTLKGWNKNEK